MILFPSFALIGSLSYFCFIIYILYGLRRLKPAKPLAGFPTVSVIIAARNEAANLPRLLESLVSQEYPADKLEILIADDRSTDNSWDIIQAFEKKSPNIIGLRIREISKDMTPKKNALTRAIEKSSGEIIVSTDGDCRVSTTWVKSMAEALGNKAGLCVGFSAVDKTELSLLTAFQHIDFLALMVANAGVIGMGQAWSGSGQNLAYHRSCFDEIGGFKPVAQRISGDDVYLVQAISQIKPIVFNSSPDGFVVTDPMPTMGSFLQQRIRWASNSRRLQQTKPLFLLFLISAFITNLAILLSGLLPQLLAVSALTLFLMKYFMEGIVIATGKSQFQQSVTLGAFTLWSIIQPVYIPLVGLLGLMGKFRWKQH